MSDTPLRDNRRDAVLSDCGEYRYRLSRTWNASKPTVAFVMLNPSTADDVDDDPTIRRCRGFAEDWGYGSIVVANLFAMRSSEPEALHDHPDPVGPENDDHLRAVCEEAEQVVAAWGAKGSFKDRALEVAALLEDELYALETTKAGHPSHPLYLPSGLEPEPWDSSVLEDGDSE
ncbi:DUF1643 domain-containing protein [Halopiger xanaduensis]|uniref:DUF1643 domain-containing protein n=1 Tax=Halopiger xanaduensis (strain DSM 18323 / JCM 14033 / SH-6) TaxID=797210 RepID=F8DER8_HALXS|nr:DUF1643 domain-containing protein [Halopiger xanaduensis]AEH39508.1 protein of unknown function DUF1643 [Halopiger xanaduensis SH-6]